MLRAGQSRHNSLSNLDSTSFCHSEQDYWGRLVHQPKISSLQYSASMEPESSSGFAPWARLSKALHYATSLRTWQNLPRSHTENLRNRTGRKRQTRSQSPSGHWRDPPTNRAQTQESPPLPAISLTASQRN